MEEKVLFEQIVQLQKSGIKAALATIASTKGSTPRKAGAKMLVLEDGTCIGTIGGGCGEAEVRREALQVIETKSPRLYKVDLTEDFTDNADAKVCGGIMDVFIELI